MNAPATASGRPATGTASDRRRAWHALLGKAWLANGAMVINFLAAWLVLGWVLMIFFHPGWILALGVLYAFMAAPAFGGGESFEGSEEFAFALPPTRAERYLAHLAAGGIPLLVLLLLGLLAIGLNLPQALWGLFVSSGYTEPFEPADPAFLHYGLAFAVPVAAYAFTFAIASLARSRGTVMWSWFLGGICAGALAGGGLLLEEFLWQRLVGYATVPVLLAAAPLALLAGYLRYVWKEGVSRPWQAHGGRGLGWIWIVVIVFVVLLILMGLFVSMNRSKPMEPIHIPRPPVSEVAVPERAPLDSMPENP